jgi:hypothetical protein
MVLKPFSRATARIVLAAFFLAALSLIAPSSTAAAVVPFETLFERAASKWVAASTW